MKRWAGATWELAWLSISLHSMCAALRLSLLGTQDKRSVRCAMRVLCSFTGAQYVEWKFLRYRAGGEILVWPCLFWVRYNSLAVPQAASYCIVMPCWHRAGMLGPIFIFIIIFYIMIDWAVSEVIYSHDQCNMWELLTREVEPYSRKLPLYFLCINCSDYN